MMSDSPTVSQLFSTAKAQMAATERLKRQGGGGTSDGMEPWQTSVEARLGQLHTDIGDVRTQLGGKIDKLDAKIDNRFLWLLGSFGLGFVLLASMMITGFLRLSDAIAAIHH
jgi:hypothetical protein